ncbi:hypothetical protein AGMMS49983_03340 [Clostridia bacterium]|nr:hypothetical protein AGMMS49983_03340 [Clostridia bacterium]
MDSIYKLQIVMDKAKIQFEGKYTYDNIVAAIDNVLVTQLGMLKESDDIYVGPGTRHDFAKLGKGGLFLAEQSWFSNNVKSMEYYSIDAEYPDSIDQEDWKKSMIENRRLSAEWHRSIKRPHNGENAGVQTGR